MFERIGTIGGYAKQWKLKRMAKVKITTGQVVDLNQRQSFSSGLIQTESKNTWGAKKTTKTMADKAKTSAIKQKLKQGKKLSAEELKHLKDKEPALYEKAKVIQDAREELERDLKRCKSKAEVRMALMRASMKVESQAAMADASAGAAASAMSKGAPSAGGAVSGTVGEAMNPGGAAASMETGDASVVSAPQSSEVPHAEGNTGIGADAEQAPGHTEHAQECGKQTQESTLERVFGENKNASDSAGALFEALNNSTDSGMDLPPTQLLIIRALQDEYGKFIQSKEYDELPDDMTEAEKKKYKNEPEKAEAYRLFAVCDAYTRSARAAEVRIAD